LHGIDLTSGLILLLAILGFCAIVVPKPEIGVVILAFTLPISAVPIIGDAGIFKITGLAAFAAWGLNVAVGRRRVQLAGPATVAFGIFLLSSLISAVAAGTPAGWLVFQRQLLGIGLYWMVANLVTSWAEVTRLLRWLIVSGALVIVACLYLYAAGSTMVSEAALTYAAPRMEGLSVGVNAFAQFAVVLLMIAVSGPFSGGIAHLGRLTVPAFAAAVVLTGSREAFLALAAALLLYLMIGKHRVLGILSALVFAVIPLLMPTGYFARIATIWEPGEQGWRPQLYAASLRAFTHRPVLGFGLANGPHAIYPYHNLPMELASHNTILGIMVEQGLAGAIPFAAALLLVFGAWRRNLRERRALAGNDRRSAEAVLLGALAFAVCAFFVDLQLDPTMYFLMGLLVAATNFPFPGWDRDAARNLSSKPDLRGPGQPDDGCQHTSQAAGAC
jgi:O-antigen ligase